MRAGLDRHQQSLRLGDLGHLGRRRKTFERGGEDGVGVGGATGRLAELGQRQPGLQAEAAGALLARDREGSMIGVLGAGGICGMGL